MGREKMTDWEKAMLSHAKAQTALLEGIAKKLDAPVAQPVAVSDQLLSQLAAEEAAREADPFRKVVGMPRPTNPSPSIPTAPPRVE